MPIYNNDITVMYNGVEKAVKIYIHTATSTSDNTKTVDISQYGIGEVLSVYCNTVKSGTTVLNAPIPHIVSFNANTIQYQLFSSKTTNTILMSTAEGLEYNNDTDITVQFLIISI